MSQICTLKLYKHLTLLNATCTAERLNDFIVGVANSADTPMISPQNYETCATFPGIARAQADITCTTSVLGRYVIVQLRNQGLLTLCEVQVFGKGKIRY